MYKRQHVAIATAFFNQQNDAFLYGQTSDRAQPAELQIKFISVNMKVRLNSSKHQEHVIRQTLESIEQEKKTLKAAPRAREHTAAMRNVAQRR